MVLVAYVAGLITTPAAVLGVLGGTWWWRRLRRAEAPAVELTPWVPPAPIPPQEAPVMNKMAMRSAPGIRRTVHGRRRR